MDVLLMPIWKSEDGIIRIVDLGDDIISVHILAEEILGFMLERHEIEKLTLSLAEWCGMPLFIKQMSKGYADESCNDGASP
jgi:TPP-dependent 2-oxoacid decarboxylase